MAAYAAYFKENGVFNEDIMTPSKILRVLAPLCLLVTAACASTTQNGQDNFNDPYEGMNRATYNFNKAADQAVIGPFITGYQTIIPEVPRKGISNAMRNLREPWTFVNDILQFKFVRAGRTLGRFVVNSTLGVGGLFKASDKMVIEFHSEDLGQTLAVWGFDNTPYIVLPFVGPSNGADAIGFAAYIFADPVIFGINELEVSGLNLARTAVDAVDTRSSLDSTLRSLYEGDNGYELMRSAYRQNRRYEIYDGRPPEEDSDIFDALEDDEDIEGEPENN